MGNGSSRSTGRHGATEDDSMMSFPANWYAIQRTFNFLSVFISGPSSKSKM